MVNTELVEVSQGNQPQRRKEIEKDSLLVNAAFVVFFGITNAASFLLEELPDGWRRAKAVSRRRNVPKSQK
jgi:hypothetical protein